MAVVPVVPTVPVAALGVGVGEGVGLTHMILRVLMITEKSDLKDDSSLGWQVVAQGLVQLKSKEASQMQVLNCGVLCWVVLVRSMPAQVG